METFSELLALCVWNSPATGEFPSQRSVTRSFDVFCDLHLHKQLSKQSRRRWIETPSRWLWHYCNETCAQFFSCCKSVTICYVVSNPPPHLLQKNYIDGFVRYAQWRYCSLALSHRYDWKQSALYSLSSSLFYPKEYSVFIWVFFCIIAA